MTTRRQARECALQALYAVTIGGRDTAEVLTELAGPSSESEQRRFVNDLVYGTLDYAARADAIVSPRLQGWSIDRLPSIDLLVLRMAVFELCCRPAVPVAVVMNEAVELAKRYSTEDSGRFVNGVLSAVAGTQAAVARAADDA